MTFSITDFTSQINKHGVAKNNLFMAKLTPPQLIIQTDGLETISTQNELPFFCKSVDLPSFDFQTAEVFNQGFGIAEKRPIGFQYQTLPAVFMVDSNFEIKKLFHKWFQNIFNYDVSGGHQNSINGTQFPYELNYKDDYTGTLEIDVYSNNNENAIYTYTFGNVYPVSMGNITVAWENSAEIMTLPVGFSYDTMQVTGSSAGAFNPALDRNNVSLSYLSALSAYGNIVDSIGPTSSLQQLINALTRSYQISDQLQ